MELEPVQPTVKGPAATFSGDVYYTVLHQGTAPSRMNLNLVRFCPGARTAWHSHAVGQTLHVTDGVGLVQARGGQPIRMRAGDTIYTPPGEEHWHGATTTTFMSHLALWETAPEGSAAETTTWAEHVTDQEYAAADNG